jgi:glutamate synthase (NADPH) large chain
MVALEKPLSREEQDPASFHKGQADEALLRNLIEDHHRWTGSLRARHVLDHWAEARARFIKVLPHEYARVLRQMNAAQATDATISRARARTASVAAK